MTAVGVSEETWERLKQLSEKELDRLADILDIGMSSLDDKPLSMEDKLMILSGVEDELVLKGLEEM